MAKIIDDPNIQNRITEMQEKHLSSRQIAVELQKDGVKIHINFIQDYKLYLKDLESRGDIIIVNPMLKTEPQKPKQPVSKPAEIIDTEIIEEQEEEEKEDDESGEN